MIRQRQTIQEVANDPEVQRAIARIPRVEKPLPGEPYKVRMKEIAPRVINAETSLAAANANITRLQHEVTVLRADVARLAQMILKKSSHRGLDEAELMFALRKEASR